MKGKNRGRSRSGWKLYTDENYMCKLYLEIKHADETMD